MNPWRALNPVALALACAIVTACSSSPPVARDSNVRLGDTLHGRMVPGRAHQTFTFEGVESTILDALVQTDDARGTASAPLVEIQDPSGQPLDVAAHVTSAPGANKYVIRGLVLPRTGIYRVLAKPTEPERQTFYRFSHGIRWAPMPDRKAFLSAERPQPVYIAAPRGGEITFSIKPDRRSGMVPQIQAVEDPWGGPALDRAQVPRGSALPQVAHTRDGKTVLTFIAPRSGMYKVLVGAKPGKEGVGTLHVGLRPPRPISREVFHGGGSAGGFGVPGSAATAASAAGPELPPAPPSEIEAFPPPASPTAGVAGMRAYPEPLDRPLAGR